MSIVTAPPADQAGLTPMATVLIVLVIAGIIYVFGYVRAVMHRANSDYKKTKALVPGLRKGFWKAWWAAVKVGAGVLIAVAILVYWGVSDARERDESEPVPATVSSPAKR